MAIIIDGHNLIPHIPGISLTDPDDEDKLVRLLQDYCRLRRKQVEVYFDRAPAGQAGERKFGLVRAIFVREGMTADEAIMIRLRKLGKRAKNYTVVSSDRQVKNAARAVHATVIDSATFAAEWQTLIEQEPELDPRNRLLSTEEIESWEALFRHGHPPADDRK
jgi:predicted RNA-binding protein with PIN domain